MQKIDEIEKKLFDTNNSTRQSLERVWYRNILYYLGEQWISWDTHKKGFVPKYKAGTDDPHPVDNMIFEYVRSVKALILNKNVEYHAWPNSNDQNDIQAALLSERILRNMDATGAYTEEKEMAIIWMLLTGTGFLRDYPDMGLGKWIGDTKTGDVAAEAIMPFNIFVDHGVGNTLKDKSKLGIQSLKSREWVEETFNYKPKANDKAEDVSYQKALTALVGDVSEWKGGATSGSDTDDDLVLFREIEFRPTKQYPKGRYVVRVGDETLVDLDRLPVKSESDDWMYSVEDFRHNVVPGRFWGEPGLNELISPQNIVNRIDRAIIKNREGVGRPTVVAPTGTQLMTKSRKDGSVLVVEYDPMTAGGHAPTIRYGTQLPTQVFNEREAQKQVAQDASGDPKGVLRGQAPSDSSGILVDILKETAEAGHTPDIQRVMRAFERSARKRLVIAQELFTEQRILKITGPDGKVGVINFKGSEIQGNTDIRLEPVGGFSSTQAGKVGAITQLIQSGMFNPESVTPEIRNELTRMMGLKSFNDDVSPDSARAEAENTKLANGEGDKVYVEVPLTDEDGNAPVNPMDDSEVLGENGQPQVLGINDPLFEFDDHAIHYATHRKFIISPEFQDIPEKDQVIAMAHAAAHQKRVEIAQAQAQMAALEQAGRDQ